jgi:hypothetical protein
VQHRIVRARLIPALATGLLLPVDRVLLTVSLHLVDLHQLMNLRDRLLRIQLHLVDQLQHMRQVYHIDLPSLLLMEQPRHVDLPPLMELIRQGHLRPTQLHR